MGKIKLFRDIAGIHALSQSKRGINFLLTPLIIVFLNLLFITGCSGSSGGGSGGNIEVREIIRY